MSLRCRNLLTSPSMSDEPGLGLDLDNGWVGPINHQADRFIELHRPGHYWMHELWGAINAGTQPALQKVVSDGRYPINEVIQCRSNSSCQ